MSSTPGPSSAPAEDAQKGAPAEGDSQTVETQNVRVQDAKPKDGKKKPKKRSAGAKKRGTGFEEFYCDPPLTVAEHSEEKDVIYPPHRPFVDRIEECVQRFRARRRMSPERELLFSRYLVLGGIDATVRQFQGTRNIGDDVLADSTKSAVREMTADDVIQRGVDGNRSVRFYNPNYPDHWDVDFTGVAAGFVSEHLPQLVGAKTEQFFMGVDVVLNFLKYVDRHDVCPEYADDVRAAQKICLKALEELPAITELLRRLPGHFNTSIRVLHMKPEDDDSWNFSASSDQAVPDIKYARASQAATLSILMGPNRFPADPEWSVTDKAEQTFEVLSIDPPSDATRAKYKAINQHLTSFPDIPTCGTITARSVIICEGWDNAAATSPPDAGKKCQFVLEEGILRLLVVGMKLTMGVCTLNVGLKFIQYIRGIRPSFYLFLPQELMFQYKEPVPNDRPARSVHDREDEGDDVGGRDD
ncbi:Argonaute complex, subunit Arb1 [Chaetomium tenue]|uniref:Argonaute complex, subunit Arb1 n=1 Tax=Chaetomium tenue TaxID=1854479 RepID=A0ACB7P7G1_9PEZI|nr:Argonaute complex, subunit Arb1 [Chaetomium globosum]